MKSYQSSIARALGLGDSHTFKQHSGVANKSQHTTGSSLPAPQGTDKTTATKTKNSPEVLRSNSCGDFPVIHTSLSDSNVPELRKLAQYEQACGAAVATRISFFVPTPSTVSQAQSSAQSVAATLKAYAQSGISPLVFMEPTDVNGAQLDLTKYASGAFDATLISYFQTLQLDGITSDMLGMWVYLPEGNLPVWSTTDPAIYTAVVTKMAQLQKQCFPGSEVSIMLDSQTFPAGSGWGDGSYTSLIPYVQHFPKGLIDSFGLQGFPWATPANQPSEASLYNPSVYLRVDLAMQAAHVLGTNNIWFNTGTFAQMYTNKTGQTVTATLSQRQEMLEGVIQLAQQVQSQGFSVAVHLFAQNKSAWSEATDWSYWQHIPGDKPDTAVFTTFAHDTKAAGIALWLYDSY